MFRIMVPACVAFWVDFDTRYATADASVGVSAAPAVASRVMCLTSSESEAIHSDDLAVSSTIVLTASPLVGCKSAASYAAATMRSMQSATPSNSRRPTFCFSLYGELLIILRSTIALSPGFKFMFIVATLT